MPTGIYAPGTGGSGSGLHPVDTRDASGQNLSRESLIRHGPSTVIPPVTDQLEAHYAARLESFSDGDSVGTLADQQNTNDLTQATSSKKPTFRNNATDNIGGNPVIDFDGSDDFLQAGSAFLSSAAGEVFLVGRLGSGADGNQFWFISLSDGTTSNFFVLGMDMAQSGDPMQLQQNQAGDASDQIDGDTNLGTGTNRIYGYRSSGSAYNLRLDGSDETIMATEGSDSGDWTTDLNNPDNVTLGAVDFSPEEQFYNGFIAEVLVYEKELTSTERSDVENWLNNTVGYGIF